MTHNTTNTIGKNATIKAIKQAKNGKTTKHKNVQALIAFLNKSV